MQKRYITFYQDSANLWSPLKIEVILGLKNAHNKRFKELDLLIKKDQ